MVHVPRKQEVITFKADAHLAAALERVPNRSAFIRNAILAALENTCPLCNGTGTLSVEQRRHWDRFAKDHHAERCATCQAVYLVCGAHEPEGAEHEGGTEPGAYRGPQKP